MKPNIMNLPYREGNPEWEAQHVTPQSPNNAHV